MTLSSANTVFGLVLLQKSGLCTYWLQLLPCIPMSTVRSRQGNMRLMLHRIPRLWLLEELKLSNYIKGSEVSFMKRTVTVAYITGSFTTTTLKEATYNFSYFVFGSCQHVLRERCTLRMESVRSSDPTAPTYHNISCHKSEQNIVLCGFQNVAPYLWIFYINLCADYLEIANKFTEKNQPSLWKALRPRNRALEIWS